MQPSSPLTTDQWIQIANAVGTWVAGFGTLAAVVVSLWLANRPNKVRLKVQVGVLLSMIPGVDAPPRKFIGFSVVNLGERAVTVTSVGWRTGTGKAMTYAVQLVDAREGSDVPKRLEHGENTSFMVPLSDTWPAYFADGFVKSEANLDALQGMVSTSVGQDVFTKPRGDLLKLLREALTKPGAATSAATTKPS